MTTDEPSLSALLSGPSYSDAEIDIYRRDFAVVLRRYRAMRLLERIGDWGAFLLAIAMLAVGGRSARLQALLPGAVLIGPGLILVACRLWRLAERHTWMCPACRASMRKAMENPVCPQCRLALG